MTIQYFSYGSNMLHARLQERIPSAIPVSVAVLHGHKLFFHKIHQDGSGKCDAFQTNNKDDDVYGLIYEMNEEDKEVLDEIEGVGNGYEVKEIDVYTVNENQKVRTFTYYATNINNELKPYLWYKDFVVEGAKENKLPLQYIKMLERFEAEDDLNLQRSFGNKKILEKSKGYTPSPFYKYSTYLKKRFGVKVMKISIDLGQSCPHRNAIDRKSGGCFYCNPESFMPPEADETRTVNEQITKGIERCEKKYGKGKYIAYFQAYTSTLENIDSLKQAFDDVLSFHQIVGISISTRPDTFTQKVFELLKEYEKKSYLLLEIGLESIHEKSLSFLGRNHNYPVFPQLLKRLEGLNIETCVHLITGIPGETNEDIIQTAKEMARLEKVDGIKLHHFHVVKNTLFEKEYNKGVFAVDDLNATKEKVILFLENIRPNQKVHRIIGDCNAGYLVAPVFSESKSKVKYLIEEEMIHKNRRQGKNY
ncbi:MAG: TIGR01212 family radical SAM protein [Nitrospinae bacterium]|nr:TIGR01212 family radical SAM protein [Nitrospinota bacterium]